MCDSRCSISDGFRAPYVRKTRHSYCILMACSIWSPLLPCREYIPSSLLILQWSVSLQRFLCSHSWMKTKLHTHTQRGKTHDFFSQEEFELFVGLMLCQLLLQWMLKLIKLWHQARKRLAENLPLNHKSLLQMFLSPAHLVSRSQWLHYLKRYVT